LPIDAGVSAEFLSSMAKKETPTSMKAASILLIFLVAAAGAGHADGGAEDEAARPGGWRLKEIDLARILAAVSLTVDGLNVTQTVLSEFDVTLISTRFEYPEQDCFLKK